jgi:hypothetical protein
MILRSLHSSLLPVLSFRPSHSPQDSRADQPVAVLILIGIISSHAQPVHKLYMNSSPA